MPATSARRCLIVAAAGGAFLGDNICFGIGHFFGKRTVARFFSGEKARKRLDWAEEQLEERGAYIIVIGRFIPGGRTAVTFTAGYVQEFPWHRFLRYDALAAIIWGTYAVMLGYLGGKTFEAGAVEGPGARLRDRARRDRRRRARALAARAAPPRRLGRRRRLTRESRPPYPAG